MKYYLVYSRVALVEDKIYKPINVPLSYDELIRSFELIPNIFKTIDKFCEHYGGLLHRVIGGAFQDEMRLQTHINASPVKYIRYYVPSGKYLYDFVLLEFNVIE